MPTPIQIITAKFKGTHDIGGVAAAIAASSIATDFGWEEGKPFNGATAAQIYDVRKMNCYEFVYFCSYICGINKTIGNTQATPIPLFSPSDIQTLAKPNTSIPGPSIAGITSISRGALVAGVDPVKARNNKGGFFHVGIATGAGTTIVHLIHAGWAWSDDLKSAPLVDWFDSKKYASLMLGAFDWKPQGDPFVSPLPTYAPIAGGGAVATVGSPGVSTATVTSPSRGAR